MEYLDQYLKRLEQCIDRNRYSSDYDKETVEFLEQLYREKRPRRMHSCDDPLCVTCGNPYATYSEDYDNY